MFFTFIYSFNSYKFYSTTHVEYSVSLELPSNKSTEKNFLRNNLNQWLSSISKTTNSNAVARSNQVDNC